MDEQVKIWQRVRGETPPVTDGLPGLAAGCLARAALYGTLARQLQGPGRNILLQLQENEQRCARCIKGVFRIADGAPMNPGSVPLSPDNMEVALRKCYGQPLKTLSACNARTFNGEYGPVFTDIAAKQRENCCRLAELMGILSV